MTKWNKCELMLFLILSLVSLPAAADPNCRAIAARLSIQIQLNKHGRDVNSPVRLDEVEDTVEGAFGGKASVDPQVYKWAVKIILNNWKMLIQLPNNGEIDQVLAKACVNRFY